VNVEHTDRQIEGLEFVFIELPKFKPDNRAEQKLHELWLRFLTEIDEYTEEAPDELLSCAETQEAIHYMEIGAFTREQLQIYDNTKIGIMTAQSFIDDAEEKGLAKGLAKGLEQGEEIGLAKGEEIGLAKGEEIGFAKGEEERQKLQQRIVELEKLITNKN
jgi:flagellar biosynthesis/type III secretory pathway protein FliH